jgi:subtilisin family serine protease
VLFAVTGLVASIAAPAAVVARSAADLHRYTQLKPSGRVLGDFSNLSEKNGKIGVVIRLVDAPVASYTGGVKGLAATSPAKLGTDSVKLKSAATKAYRSYLKGQRDKFVDRLQKEVKGVRVGQSYDLAFNGIAAKIAKSDVARVAALSGVAAVYPDTLQKPQTDTSPGFVGAPVVWSQLGGQDEAGEGVIVGVLDTGIWPEHPSFADPDENGNAYPAPPAAPDGDRACEFGTGLAGEGDPFTCNNKLIGAQRFMETYDFFNALDPGEFTTARDDDGHGTHTSSTAAGNSNVEASIFGVDRGIISGLAPRAHVIMYKVCGLEGCYDSDTTAAVEEAVEDGVDVINFSISGGANPFTDSTELAFLGAYNAGVFVAASAGNAGPGADTTDHRGPWVTTVGASTAPRAFVNQIQLTADGGAHMTINGISLTDGIGPLPVIVATGDGLCGDDTGPYAGEIVVCKRGTQGRAEKGFNVAAAGGAGMILYNQSAAVTDQETDNHYLPASHIQFSQGTSLLAWLASHTGEMATITAGVTGAQQADVMASFSSRGGPGQSLGVSKPDITAPGVQILAGMSPSHPDVAAGPEGEYFQAIAGTSMSSPHVAGAGALLTALHPSWTPGQIHSALMTSARRAGLVKEDGHTPFDAFDAGSGRLNLRGAGSPGLTFDATGAEFLANEDNLFLANYPSVFVPAMPGIVTLQRRATNVLGFGASWRITATADAGLKITVPSGLFVGAGATRSFNIGLDASAVPVGETRFGLITMEQTTGPGAKHKVNIPVTIVRGQAPLELLKECTPTNPRKGNTTDCTLTISNTTFESETVTVTDVLPSRLGLIDSSVVGAAPWGSNGVRSSFTIIGSEPADVSIGSITPVNGYLDLSLFGCDEYSMTDEDAINFDVDAFEFAGELWTSIAAVSDGYLVVGGADGPDIQFINQALPDPTRPNNVIAPWWSDMNPGDSGTLRVCGLTDGVDSWLVFEFSEFAEFGTAGATTDSFEVWIGVDGDGNTGEDIEIAYGTLDGDGADGFLTVGVENRFGNRGDMVYLDGSGTLPVAGDSLRVTSVPGTLSTAEISYSARAKFKGAWRNCASMTSSGFFGTSVSCINGVVRKKA